MTGEYELFALGYATRQANRHEHFIGGDPHNGPMPMDYFVWLVRNTHRAVVIDVDLRRKAGASGAGAWNAVRSTPWRFCGVDPAVEGVILTHMHYDHVGNFDKPP